MIWNEAATSSSPGRAYIAAHSPTQREMLQTAEIVRIGCIAVRTFTSSERHEGVFTMTLAHGTDRLESARLVLRRITPGRSAVLHSHPRTPRSRAESAIPEAGRARPKRRPHGCSTLSRAMSTLALGYLAVLRKEDGALIGRCGLMDLVVESAAPEHGIRRGWFGREQAPAGVALTFECELGYTFDPAVWGQGFATEAARCVRDYARDVLRLAVRDLGHSSAERPLAARRRTVRRASRRPDGRGRSHVGTLRVAARDSRRGSPPAGIHEIGMATRPFGP